MTVKSMTGFARTAGSHSGTEWQWELRSVNGRALDLRLRVPPGLEGLEPKLREAFARRIARGSISVNLSLRRPEGGAEVRLNEAALAQVLKAAERIQQLTGCERPRAEGLLALKGVLETAETVEDESVAQARQTAMLATLDRAIDDLIVARGEEGARLAAVLSAQLDEVERMVALIETHPSRTPDAVAARLREQIARLLDSSTSLDPARLHQEAVLVATRADVEEEIKRLRSHIAAARDLIAQAGPSGRKLDFLAQEFNREANTICSKSNDTEVTRAGLALKVVIDQLREQVQNIE